MALSASDVWKAINEGKRLALPGLFAATETLAAARPLTSADGNFLKFDPGGASRDVTLVAEEGASGAFYWIANAADAAENLVLKNDAGSTIVTINQNESAVVWCSGSAWTLFAVVAIALS